MSNKRDRQKANRAAKVAAAEATARSQRTRSRIITYGTAGVIVLTLIVIVNLLSGRSDDGTIDVASTTTDPVVTTPATTTIPKTFIYGSGECPAEDGSSPRAIDFGEPQPLCTDPSVQYTAVFDTSEGEVRVTLDAAAAPGTVNNFVTLARWGYYDGTTIFRSDPSIDILQGGSPHTESASDPGPGYRITDEPTFSTDTTTGQLRGPYDYWPGQLVMARSAGPDSASAQFFFATGENVAALNAQGTYVVFGEADDDGLEVLKSIIGLHVPDPTSGLGGKPSRTVTINKVVIEEG